MPAQPRDRESEIMNLRFQLFPPSVHAFRFPNRCLPQEALNPKKQGQPGHFTDIFTYDKLIQMFVTDMLQIKTIL